MALDDVIPMDSNPLHELQSVAEIMRDSSMSQEATSSVSYLLKKERRRQQDVQQVQSQIETMRVAFLTRGLAIFVAYNWQVTRNSPLPTALKIFTVADLVQVYRGIYAFWKDLP